MKNKTKFSPNIPNFLPLEGRGVGGGENKPSNSLPVEKKRENSSTSLSPQGGWCRVRGKIKILTDIAIIISGIIVGLKMSDLYRLTTRNLVLENWLLEQEINDYVSSRVLISETTPLLSSLDRETVVKGAQEASDD